MEPAKKLANAVEDWHEQLPVLKNVIVATQWGSSHRHSSRHQRQIVQQIGITPVISCNPQIFCTTHRGADNTQRYNFQQLTCPNAAPHFPERCWRIAGNGEFHSIVAWLSGCGLPSWFRAAGTVRPPAWLAIATSMRNAGSVGKQAAVTTGLWLRMTGCTGRALVGWQAAGSICSVCTPDRRVKRSNRLPLQRL